MLGIEAIKITPEIMARAAAIDEFKGLWTGFGDYTTKLKAMRDVAAHGAAFERVLKSLQEQALEPEMVCTLHAALVMKAKGPSSYKSEDNQLTIMKGDIPAGSLETAPPEQVGPLMEKLVEWLNETLAREDFHPLLTIGVFTAVFLQISPFQEGNMRIASFLLILLLLKSGYAYAPYESIDKIMSRRGDIVFRTLKHNQRSLESGHPDWSQWLVCFFTLLQDQTKTMHERLAGKDNDMSYLPPLSEKILKTFTSKERLSMKEIIQITNGRRSTIKLRLGELVEGGYLRRHGKGRSTWYSQI